MPERVPNTFNEKEVRKAFQRDQKKASGFSDRIDDNVDNIAINAAAIVVNEGGIGVNANDIDDLEVELAGNAYNKTGWDSDVQAEVTLSLNEGTRTVTVTPTGASANYYIDGILYTFSTPQEVTFTDTEGEWFIYFSGSTLIASQTIFTLNGTDAWVSMV